MEHEIDLDLSPAENACRLIDSNAPLEDVIGIIESDSDLFEENDAGWTPAEMMVKEGDASYVEAIINLVGDVDWVDSKDRSLLFHAIEAGNTSTALALIEAMNEPCLNPNEIMQFEGSLNAACNQADEELIVRLLEIGLDPGRVNSLPTEFETTPWHDLARSPCHPGRRVSDHVWDQLLAPLDLGDPVGKEAHSPVQLAILSLNVDAVRSIDRSDPEILDRSDIISPELSTALRKAENSNTMWLYQEMKAFLDWRDVKKSEASLMSCAPETMRNTPGSTL